MAKIVKVPVLGQSVEEVRILRWYKQVGDTIAVGEPLAEIETDKVNIDFESPEAGVIRRILADVDSFVKVEAPVVIIGTADEPIDELETGGAQPVSAPPAAATTEISLPSALPDAGGSATATSRIAVVASPRAQRAAADNGVDLQILAGRGTGPKGRVQEKDIFSYLRDAEQAAADTARGPKASPLARAVATGTGLDLAGVSGTGAGGKIVAGDVRSAGAPAAPVAAPVSDAASQAAGGSHTETLSGLRKRVADNISRSIRTAPHVTLNLSVDMSQAMRLRKELLPAIEKATGGVRVSPTDIIVKAAAVALKEFPYVNAHIDGDTLTRFDDVHIGLAVSLGDAGLIVPVIKDVGRKGLAQIAADRQELAGRARKSQLGGADISGGTFTVSNLGNYGIESFNPVINPPQVAILGVCGIIDTVVPVDGVPAIRPMMGLSLSFDHRAMDGAPAAAFLARLKEILETPSLLLL